jgi:hypothetical protein
VESHPASFKLLPTALPFYPWHSQSPSPPVKMLSSSDDARGHTHARKSLQTYTAQKGDQSITVNIPRSPWSPIPIDATSPPSVRAMGSSPTFPCYEGNYDARVDECEDSDSSDGIEIVLSSPTESAPHTPPNVRRGGRVMNTDRPAGERHFAPVCIFSPSTSGTTHYA